VYADDDSAFDSEPDDEEYSSEEDDEACIPEYKPGDRTSLYWEKVDTGKTETEVEFIGILKEFTCLAQKFNLDLPKIARSLPNTVFQETLKNAGASNGEVDAARFVFVQYHSLTKSRRPNPRAAALFQYHVGEPLGFDIYKKWQDSLEIIRLVHFKDVFAELMRDLDERSTSNPACGRTCARFSDVLGQGEERTWAQRYISGVLRRLKRKVDFSSDSLCQLANDLFHSSLGLDYKQEWEMHRDRVNGVKLAALTAWSERMRENPELSLNQISGELGLPIKSLVQEFPVYGRSSCILLGEFVDHAMARGNNEMLEKIAIAVHQHTSQEQQDAFKATWQEQEQK
jgi:hypothetical protein